MRKNLSILTIDLRNNPGYDEDIHHRLVIKMSKNIRYLFQQFKMKEYNSDSIAGEILKLKNLESKAKQVELVQNFLLLLVYGKLFVVYRHVQISLIFLSASKRAS